MLIYSFNSILYFQFLLKLQKTLYAIKKPFVAKLKWIRPEKNKHSQLKYMYAKKNIRPEKEILKPKKKYRTTKKAYFELIICIIE